MNETLFVPQMALTCCTISSTLILHLHPTILHNIQTQPTAVSLLQLVNGKCLTVLRNIVLCASQSCQVSLKLLFLKKKHPI